MTSAVPALLARPRGLDVAHLGAVPVLGVAVITCMDARIDLNALLGLRAGEAHVMRNAGGIVTDGELRSLAISQRKLGTRSVVVLTHTGCGMASFTDEDFLAELADDTGEAPGWAPGAFSDPFAAARAGVATVRASPYLPHTDDVHGLVLDLETGEINPAGGCDRG